MMLFYIIYMHVMKKINKGTIYLQVDLTDGGHFILKKMEKAATELPLPVNTCLS